MRIDIYIKSSVKTLKRLNGTVGFVLEAEGYEGNTITQFGVVKNVTDNQSQLLALKFALKRINDKSNLVIHTDNRHIAAAFSQGWINTWKENDFKNAKGKEVANAREWREVLNLLGDNIPEFDFEDHSYSQWLPQEVERRAKKYV